MTDPQAMTSAHAFAELGRINFRETDLAAALAKVADLAKGTISGADEVSITLVGAGGAHTAAYTGERAVTVDEWQYQQGHGPCLAAAAANITVTVPDMAGESRWPDWADRAIDAGIHSCMSIGLPLHECVSGAVNVYATKPHAFDDDAVLLAETFGGYAAVAMANAHRSDGTALPDRAHTAMNRPKASSWPSAAARPTKRSPSWRRSPSTPAAHWAMSPPCSSPVPYTPPNAEPSSTPWEGGRVGDPVGLGHHLPGRDGTSRERPIRTDEGEVP
jgi:transcriptional regulator with GAF, ATPase, and Fis domain